MIDDEPQTRRFLRQRLGPAGARLLLAGPGIGCRLPDRALPGAAP